MGAAEGFKLLYVSRMGESLLALKQTTPNTLSILSGNFFWGYTAKEAYHLIHVTGARLHPRRPSKRRPSLIDLMQELKDTRMAFLLNFDGITCIIFHGDRGIKCFTHNTLGGMVVSLKCRTDTANLMFEQFRLFLYCLLCVCVCLHGDGRGVLLGLFGGEMRQKKGSLAN